MMMMMSPRLRRGRQGTILVLSNMTKSCQATERTTSCNPRLQALVDRFITSSAVALPTSVTGRPRVTIATLPTPTPVEILVVVLAMSSVARLPVSTATVPTMAARLACLSLLQLGDATTEFFVALVQYQQAFLKMADALLIVLRHLPPAPVSARSFARSSRGRATCSSDTLRRGLTARASCITICESSGPPGQTLKNLLHGGLPVAVFAQDLKRLREPWHPLDDMVKENTLTHQGYESRAQGRRVQTRRVRR